MAWDLWSSTYDQVVHHNNYYEHFGWQCDFYSGCGRDVIEEDALNEKSCVQVLRNLIRKADAEIEELEKDLLSLQNEIAWAEHQNWPEKCCSALTEKINWLDFSIRSLKNDHADNTETQLLLQNEPAETLNEIVKATQREYCQDTCGQPLDVNMSILNPCMNVSKHAVDKESSNINSNKLIKEEQIEVCAENSTSSKLLMELHKKRSDSPVKIEVEKATANTYVKDSSPVSLKLAAGHPGEEKILAVCYSGGNEVEETKEHIFAAEDRLLNENILMCPENKRSNPEADKELLATTVVRSPDLLAIIYAPGPSDGMSVLGTSDLKVLGNEEVRRSQLITSDMGQILNSFSSESKGNIPIEAKQEEATVKDVTADAFGPAAGIEGRKKCLDSKLHASQGAKSESSDLDQKLCDFAPKTARRDCKKDSKVASIQNLGPSNRECHSTAPTPLQVVATQALCLANPELYSLKARNGKNSPDVLNIQSASLKIRAKNSVLSSVLEMQTKSSLFTGSQLTDEGKSQALCLKSETVANLSESNMSLPVKLKNQGKRKSESDAGEPGDTPMDVISNSSLKVTPKRPRKSQTSIDGANLDESPNRKVTKRAVQHGQHDTEEYAIVPYDSKFSELQKRRNVSKLPITVGIQDSYVDMGSPNSDGVAMDKGNHEDLQTSRSCSLVGSHNETSALLPISLKSLTLNNLRAIAKQHNVKKYYRLAKGPLVEQLAHRLSSC